ncbi:MAG: polysaccharide deacetylase family protein [Steroidobacteraceae bacterium]
MIENSKPRSSSPSEYHRAARQSAGTGLPAKNIIKDVLGRAAYATGVYARQFRSKLVVTAFHRVNAWMTEDGITCGPARFEEFCRFFAEHFHIVPLSEQVAGCREGRGMGGTLSITFDDGYEDNLEVAAPILRKLGLPATFFLATAFIGTDYVPPWDRELSRRPGWMSWDQVRALRDQGFEIGAHTDTHIDLGQANADAVRGELALCRDKLQRELGIAPTLFAYPFGGRNNISPASLDLVREAGFECCLGACGGVNPPVADPFHLNRINVNEWFATPHQLGFELVARRI